MHTAHCTARARAAPRVCELRVCGGAATCVVRGLARTAAQGTHLCRTGSVAVTSYTQPFT